MFFWKLPVNQSQDFSRVLDALQLLRAVGLPTISGVTIPPARVHLEHLNYRLPLYYCRAIHFWTRRFGAFPPFPDICAALLRGAECRIKGDGR